MASIHQKVIEVAQQLADDGHRYNEIVDRLGAFRDQECHLWRLVEHLLASTAILTARVAALESKSSQQ